MAYYSTGSVGLVMKETSFIKTMFAQVIRKPAVIVLVFLSLASHAQNAQKFNLGFEIQSQRNDLSDGWRKWGDFDLKIDTIANSGRKSGKVMSSEASGPFGGMFYSIPANYSGDTIRLEGYMKMKNVESGFAGLVLKVARNGTSLAFDNMYRQKITGTRDWQKYSITLAYPEGADTIYVGGILAGRGEAWFDDFTVTIDDKNIQTLHESAKIIYKASLDKEFDRGSGIEITKLDAPTIDNLELLGRVWGYLKYRHPEIGNGNYNWDYELLRFLPGYLRQTEVARRDELLLGWIDGLGELPVCKKCLPAPDDAFLKPDLNWVSKSIISEKLRSKLLSIDANRHQGNHFYIKSQPAGNPDFSVEESYSQMPYPDDGFRLLSLFRYWNMINYFFPYKHLTDKDWNLVLGEYIPKFVNANNELEYELAVLLLIGEIQDTHAGLRKGDDKIQQWKGNYFSPVKTQFVGRQLVVIGFHNPPLAEKIGLKVGDVITHINGRKTEDIVSEISRYYPASNEAARLNNISYDILRSYQSRTTVNYLRDGTERTAELELYEWQIVKAWPTANDGQCYKMLDNNIGYITLKSIKSEDIPVIQEKFKETKGIIIDIRNYPSVFVPFLLGSYFMSAATPFAKFTIPVLDNPGEFKFVNGAPIPASRNAYTNKLIILVNEQSISQSEYTAMAFRAGNNTTIVGSTTAGADGNVSYIPLPGGLGTTISGIGVYYPDGRETQRIGIVPDVEVHPTIEGIRKGRDEVLEKAVEIILGE